MKIEIIESLIAERSKNKPSQKKEIELLVLETLLKDERKKSGYEVARDILDQNNSSI